jgi:Cof subfamily protein (haloacid dehalogenase superfamily)
MKTCLPGSIKALAFDLDGTLTNSKKCLLDSSKLSISHFQSLGTTIILASGRPLLGVLPIARLLELDKKGGFLICLNGALIYDCKNKKALFDSVIPASILPSVFSFAKSVGIASLTYDDTSVVTESPQDHYVAIEARNNAIPIKGVPNLSAYVSFPIEKVMFVGLPSKISAFIGSMQKAFPQLAIYQSEPYFLEIMNQGINKRAALSFLLNHLNIEPKQLMSFGDGLNDLPMLEYSGVSIAMGNAPLEVKKEADYVTKSNDDDGISWALGLYERGELCLKE